MDAKTYNYRHFPLDMEEEVFAAFPSAPRAGSRAPNGEVVDVAEGTTTSLRAIWKKGPLVIEFGSRS